MVTLNREHLRSGFKNKLQALQKLTNPEVLIGFRFILQGSPHQHSIWPLSHEFKITNERPGSITFQEAPLIITREYPIAEDKGEEHFQEMFKRLVTAEFPLHNIDYAASSMWEAHRQLYGSSCSNCFPHLGILSSQVRRGEATGVTFCVILFPPFFQWWPRNTQTKQVKKLWNDFLACGHYMEMW